MSFGIGFGSSRRDGYGAANRDWKLQALLRVDRVCQALTGLWVLLQELSRVLTPLPDTLAVVRVPGAALFNEALFNTQID